MTHEMYLVLIGISIGIFATPILYWIAKSVKRLPQDLKEYASVVLSTLRK